MHGHGGTLTSCAFACQEEEVGFLQAVSEDLLKRRPPASPHWHLLNLLAVHGTSRLLQVILGPCSPNINIQVRIYHTPGCPGGEGQAGAWVPSSHIAPSHIAHFSLQQHEALTGTLMQILHKLEQALQELGGSSDAITMETPLISIYTHR